MRALLLTHILVLSSLPFTPADKLQNPIFKPEQQRSLRGGISSRGGYSGGSSSSSSYSSGGSSYHSSSSSSSSSYHSSTSYNHGYGRGGSDYSYSRNYYSGSTSNLGIFLFAFLFLCCPCVACCIALPNLPNGSSSSNNNSNQSEEQEQFLSNDYNRNTYGSDQPFTMPKGRFEAFLLRAKQEVENNPTQLPPSASPSASAEPHSGKYKTSYIDRTTQVQWNATIDLHFTKDYAGTGYRISGEGYDVDGSTVIEDGYANPDGTAWWRERVITGDVGLEVVSRGRFDFVKRTFQGNWLANSGEEAVYMHFQAEEEPPDYGQGQQPTPSAPMEDDTMPVATAVGTRHASQDEFPFVVATAVDDPR